LANQFGDIEKLKRASLEDLLKIKDIGEIVAKSIYNWFRDKRNLALLERLAKAGVRIINPSLQLASRSSRRLKKLRDKTFVFTGELESMTRDEAKEKVRELGGDVFVVVGKEPGNKYEKAKKLGVKIINEREFLKMIK